MALLPYGPPLLPLQQQQTHSGWTAQRCGGGRNSSDGLGGLVMGSAGSSFFIFYLINRGGQQNVSENWSFTMTWI